MNVITSAVGCGLGHEPSAMSSGTVQGWMTIPVDPFQHNHWSDTNCAASAARANTSVLTKRNDEFCNRLSSWHMAIFVFWMLHIHGFWAWFCIPYVPGISCGGVSNRL
jgi:hypothetical protein